MSPVRLADTNLIIRYLMRDHAVHAAAAEKLFAAAESGELTMVILPSILAGCED